MGPHGAINIIFRNEIKEARNPDEKHAELVSEYRRKFASPYIAAQKGYIDEVIIPAETRPKLISALESLLTKREQRPSRKHSNLPL